MAQRTDAVSAARARGRPRKFDAEVVMDKALNLFWKNGFSNTTTRDLEVGLGINQSSLYNQFGSKQALLDGALARYEELTDAALLKPMHSEKNGLQAIRIFFRELASWVTRDGKRGCMLINMMAEDGASTDSIRKRTRKYRLLVRNTFKECLQRAVDDGFATPADPADCEQRADLLLGLVLGFNIAARGGASERELKKLLDAVDAYISAWQP